MVENCPRDFAARGLAKRKHFEEVYFNRERRLKRFFRENLFLYEQRRHKGARFCFGH